MPDIDDPPEELSPPWLTSRARFWLWFCTAAIYPAAEIALAVMYPVPSRPPPPGYQPGWPLEATEWLFEGAVVHAAYGILFLRGNRFVATLLAVPFLVLMFACAWGAATAIDGYDM